MSPGNRRQPKRAASAALTGSRGQWRTYCRDRQIGAGTVARVLQIQRWVAGAVFHKGKLLERPTDINPASTAFRRWLSKPERRSPEEPRSTGLDNFSETAPILPITRSGELVIPARIRLSRRAQRACGAHRWIVRY